MSVDKAMPLEKIPQGRDFADFSLSSDFPTEELQTSSVPRSTTIRGYEPPQITFIDGEAESTNAQKAEDADNIAPDDPDNIAPDDPDNIAPSHPDDIAPDYPSDFNPGEPGAVQKGVIDIGKGLSPVPPALPKTPARRLPQGFFA